MRVWIEAYWICGSQILGNGDGQGAIHAKDYRRTKHYKAIVAGQFKRPAYFRVVNDKGERLETIFN